MTLRAGNKPRAYNTRSKQQYRDVEAGDEIFFVKVPTRLRRVPKKVAA